MNTSFLKAILLNQPRILVLISSFILAACAPTGTRESSEEKIAATLEDMELDTHGKVDRIPSYRINSWRYIDEHHIIIEAARNDHYLVEFSQPCLGTRSAFQIGFTDTVGGLTKFDRILVESRGVAGGEQCHIREIVKLMDRE